jgi:N-acetylglutamate synthase-like GNAT family acetyltransferase
MSTLGRAPWVGGMIVRPDLRGSGVGTILMAGLDAWARAAGIAQAWVVTARRAIDFYRQVRLGRRRDRR